MPLKHAIGLAHVRVVVGVYWPRLHRDLDVVLGRRLNEGRGEGRERAWSTNTRDGWLIPVRETCEVKAVAQQTTSAELRLGL